MSTFNLPVSTFKVKEAFYSLQGEGARAGRPAVFCRFSKCNLWNGREQSRSNSICTFCDTDILGTDGQNGGVFHSSNALVMHLKNLWPIWPEPQIAGSQPLCESSKSGKPYLIFTGGEPALQLTEDLVETCQKEGFEVAIETNGTVKIPKNLDWVCVSPKSTANLLITQANELKLVYPQSNCLPEHFDHFNAEHFFLSPMAPYPGQPILTSNQEAHRTKTLNYCLKNPKWRLSLQLHKLLNIE